MSGYAVTIDGAGFRAVSGPGDVGEGERYSKSVPPTKKHTPTEMELEMALLQAYADPISGSDRHFSKAARLEAMGAASTEIESAKSTGIARYMEIQKSIRGSLS